MWILYDESGKILATGIGNPTPSVYTETGKIVVEDNIVLQGDIIHPILVVDRISLPGDFERYAVLGKYKVTEGAVTEVEGWVAPEPLENLPGLE